jgi:hypothetical protein
MSAMLYMYMPSLKQHVDIYKLKVAINNR